MKKEKTLQIVGWLQLMFGILLCIAAVSAYFVYRNSVGDVSRSLSASILSTSDVIRKVAEALKVRQELIDTTSQTLLSSRKLVVEIQASTEAQGKLLPQYASNLMNTAAIAAALGKTLIGVGDRLQFEVPTSVGREGIKPTLIRTRPLEDHGKALKTHGESIQELGKSLTGIANSLNNNAPKLNAAFADTSRQTIKLLDAMAAATEKLSSQDLPKAITALEVTSQHLRQASDQASGIEGLAVILMLVGLVLAGLGASSGVASLLIAQSWKHDTSRDA